jgi:DNA polymerase-3 subunit gamma/tau
VPDDVSALDEIVEALCERDTGRAIIAVDAAMATGRTPRVLGENLVARLRDVFLAAMKADLGRLPESDRGRVADQARRLGAAGSTRALEVLGEAFVGIQDAPDPRVVLEVALVRLTKPEADHSPAAIVERLERLERGLGPIGAAPPPAPPLAAHPHVDTAPDVDPEAVTNSTLPEAMVDDGQPPAAADRRGGGKADEARQVLAARRQGKGAAPARKAAPAGPPAERPRLPGAPPPRKAAALAAPASAPAPATPPASAPAAGTGTGSGELPSRDALTLAWGDTILGTLSGKAKSRFAAGRFVTVDGATAHFGLPNKVHAARCEDVRAEVEAALAAHFGTPVPLTIVVDGDAPVPYRGPVPVAPSPGDGPGDEGIDLSELRDATDVTTSSVDRIAEVFPGVEVVEE